MITISGEGSERRVRAEPLHVAMRYVRCVAGSDRLALEAP
jgi:hypothetical protein